MTEITLEAVEHAFSLPDPTPKLLELIQAKPILPTISTIAIIYIDQAQQSPSQVDKLVDTLVKLKNSTTTVAAGARLSKPTQMTMAQALDSELYEFLSSNLADPEEGSVTSSNTYLATSLLSAKTAKNSLCKPFLFADQVDRDLNYDDPDSGRFDVATHEVRVLCACLLLTMCGSHLLGEINFDISKVLTTLEKIKNVGVVKDPHGQQLLEVTIGQVKDGLKSDIDGWNILFPQ